MDLNRLKIDRAPSTPVRAAPRRRGWTGIIVLILFLALLGGGLYLFRTPLLARIDQLRLPRVTVLKVREQTAAAASAVAGVSANGYIVAAKRAALSADLPGRIVALYVTEGSTVDSGEVVARLDSDEAQAALRRAEADLEAAKVRVKVVAAELGAAHAALTTLRKRVQAAAARTDDAAVRLESAERELARVQALGRQASRKALDDAELAVKSATKQLTAERASLASSQAELTANEARIAVTVASLQEAQAQLPIREALRDEADARLEKTTVRAPFDGVVVLKDAEVGEIVGTIGGSSRGSVATMVDFRSLEVQVDLPESNLAAAPVGTPTHVYLDAYPTHRYLGEVSRIWPTANRQKATVEVRIVFLAPDDKLRPEMGVRVVLSPEAYEDGPEEPVDAAPAIIVPEECIVRSDGTTAVFVLERGVAKWREITLGEGRSGRFQILAGLTDGESIVFQPPVGLSDGDRVLREE